VISRGDLVGACQIISNLRITSEHSNSFKRERKSKREIERDRETERDRGKEREIDGEPTWLRRLRPAPATVAFKLTWLRGDCWQCKQCSSPFNCGDKWWLFVAAKFGQDLCGGPRAKIPDECIVYTK